MAAFDNFDILDIGGSKWNQSFQTLGGDDVLSGVTEEFEQFMLPNVEDVCFISQFLQYIIF